MVEPASIAVARRHRRAKTDTIDGEALLRTLMADTRGEPRVCSVVVPPSPEEEDRRRLSRERQTLVAERIEPTNRINGLLAAQRVTDDAPLRPDCRERLERLRTGDGRLLPPRLKAEIGRALDRLAPLQGQIAAVEAERAALLAADEAATPAARRLTLKSIGPEFASVLWLEGLLRRFQNRRPLAAYAGLAPSPWQSGTMNGEQGISKAGHPRLRTAMVELAGTASPSLPPADRCAMAVAAPSARHGAEPLVSPARAHRARPGPSRRHRRSRSEASGRLVAVCDPWRGPAGGQAQSGLTSAGLPTENAIREAWPASLIRVSGPPIPLAATCRPLEWSHSPEPSSPSTGNDGAAAQSADRM